MFKNLVMFAICCLIVSRSSAEKTFDRSDERTQAFVVKSIGEGIRNGDVVIAQIRADEIYRDEAPIPSGRLQVLGLEPLRMVKPLKGRVDVPYAKVFEVYWNSGELNVSAGRSPVAFWNIRFPDDFVRLVIVRKQPEPIRERIADRDLPEFSPFARDGRIMPMTEFMRKYDLNPLFSNRVYQLASGCSFVVDYPEPTVEAKNPEIRAIVEREDARIRANRQTRAKTRNSMDTAFKLSNREASEIVYVAYLFDGKEGPARYAAAAKGDPLLEPIERGDFKTNLGRRLYEAVRTELGEINTARGSQH